MLPDELREVPLRPTPHLVILGAGASRAVSPDGEALGRTLPLTNELPSALDLEDLLDGSAMEDAGADFEAFFSSLAEAGESDLGVGAWLWIKARSPVPRAKITPLGSCRASLIGSSC